MTRITNSGERTYRSELRAQQAKETRARILDATIRVMASGVANLSVPAVAREAGVSVPTVYRHFGTKADLLSAIYPHLAGLTGLDDLVMPTTVDEFREMVRTVFSRLESVGGPARVAMASPVSDEARRVVMPGRIADSRRFAARVAPGASPADQERIARVFVVLVSSSAMRMWREHLGASVDEATDDIDWILRAAIASATGRKDQ